MLTTSNPGISRATSSKLYYQAAERTARPQESAAHHSYDSVTISAAGESRFQKDLVSRISNEIRTATTTGDLQKYRAQVADGSYTVDPSAIAARILRMEG